MSKIEEETPGELAVEVVVCLRQARAWIETAIAAAQPFLDSSTKADWQLVSVLVEEPCSSATINCVAAAVAIAALRERLAPKERTIEPTNNADFYMGDIKVTAEKRIGYVLEIPRKAKENQNED